MSAMHLLRCGGGCEGPLLRSPQGDSGVHPATVEVAVLGRAAVGQECKEEFENGQGAALGPTDSASRGEVPISWREDLCTTFQKCLKYFICSLFIIFPCELFYMFTVYCYFLVLTSFPAAGSSVLSMTTSNTYRDGRSHLGPGRDLSLAI